MIGMEWVEEYARRRLVRRRNVPHYDGHRNLLTGELHTKEREMARRRRQMKRAVIADLIRKFEWLRDRRRQRLMPADVLIDDTIRRHPKILGALADG